MQQWLKREWNVKAVVLYDKPPMFFHPTSVSEKHALFQKLANEFDCCRAFVDDDKGTIMTDERGAERNERPAFLISSTSWTEDEDFGIFLDALTQLAERSKQDSKMPNIVVVVTGKGPQKQHYEEKISKLAFERIRILTMWLEAEDYPRLLGCADLGICLHTSTSGLDLPMKVLDMFGCNVPVCAVDFNCLDELVKHDVNGMVFKRSDELAGQMYLLLQNFPNNLTLKRLRKGVQGIQVSADDEMID